MVTADMGLVSMVRQGILALQLLPSNSSAGQRTPHRTTLTNKAHAIFGWQTVFTLTLFKKTPATHPAMNGKWSTIQKICGQWLSYGGLFLMIDRVEQS